MRRPRLRSLLKTDHWSAADVFVAIAALVVTLVFGFLTYRQSHQQTDIQRQQARLENKVEARASSPVLSALLAPERPKARVLVSTVAGRVSKPPHRVRVVSAWTDRKRASPFCNQYADGQAKRVSRGVPQVRCYELIVPVRNVGEGVAAVQSVKALHDCGEKATKEYMREPLTGVRHRRLGVFNVPPGEAEQVVWQMIAADGRRAQRSASLFVIVRYTDFHLARDRFTCMIFRGRKYRTFDTQYADDRPLQPSGEGR
jgi:hypothetical protein